MREIKFRGKCFDNEWVFGDLLQSNITQIIAKKGNIRFKFRIGKNRI